jgi:hypothetical protein
LKLFFSLKLDMMNYFSCLFAIFLIVTHNQFSSSTTVRATIDRQDATTSHQGVTTGHPSSTTTSNALLCVCSCCAGYQCKPITLRIFAYSTCTTGACQDECKALEPKTCRYNCTVQNKANIKA